MTPEARPDSQKRNRDDGFEATSRFQHAKCRAACRDDNPNDACEDVEGM